MLDRGGSLGGGVGCADVDNKDFLVVAVIEAVTLADLEVAWDIVVSWRDQDFSIFERTSFAVMRRLGIDRVASFDAHFAAFRFGPKCRQSFQVLG